MQADGWYKTHNNPFDVKGLIGLGICGANYNFYVPNVTQRIDKPLEVTSLEMGET